MSEAWVSREEWERRLAGENCPFCALKKDSYPDNEYSLQVVQLERSVLRLSRDQNVRGYCVLIALNHFTEPFQMREGERRLFFEDMARAAEAMQKVFNPDKMNYELLGNAVPHMHVHLVPRYLGDPAPHQPIYKKAESGPVMLSDAEYAQIIGDLREALGFLRVPVTDPNLMHLLDKQGRVTRWPHGKKQEEQKAVRHYIASKFEEGRTYSEREVNEVINAWHLFEDWATLRRELYDFGYLHREKNGSTYWVENLNAEDVIEA